MATTTKLLMNFTKSDGDLISMSYNHAKKEFNKANVKSLMEGIVANGAIFEKTPFAIKSAKVITTESVDVDLN